MLSKWCCQPVLLVHLQLSGKSFPLCMRQLHQSLRENHHLRHGGRMQYGLFLKGIGLSLEQALQFWRSEFTRGKVDADQVKALLLFLGGSCLFYPIKVCISYRWGTMILMATLTGFNCTGTQCCSIWTFCWSHLWSLGTQVAKLYICLHSHALFLIAQYHWIATEKYVHIVALKVSTFLKRALHKGHLHKCPSYSKELLMRYLLIVLDSLAESRGKWSISLKKVWFAKD